IDVAPLVKRLKEDRQWVTDGRVGRGRKVGRQNRHPRQIGGTLRTGLPADGGEIKPTEEEGPPLHSTTSARARIEGGTVMSSALAVLRLTTSSNLVGCCTGKSAGLAPLRIIPA